VFVDGSLEVNDARLELVALFSQDFKLLSKLFVESIGHLVRQFLNLELEKRLEVITASTAVEDAGEVDPTLGIKVFGIAGVDLDVGPSAVRFGDGAAVKTVADGRARDRTREPALELQVDGYTLVKALCQRNVYQSAGNILTD
jgi:hypothetical protein